MSDTVREVNGNLVVRLAGEIDLDRAPEVRRLLLDSVKRSLDVLVDLSAVTYIDSSGIASLVEGYQAARGKELAFGLTGATEAVMRVFKLARLDRVFPFFESVAEFREHVR